MSRLIPKYRTQPGPLLLKQTQSLGAFFARSERLDAETREELSGHIQRAEAAIRKLEVEATKRHIIQEAKNISALPDAHLVNESMLSPSSEKIQSAYEGFNADLIDYDVFNELEEAYVRLKVEGDLGA